MDTIRFAIEDYVYDESGYKFLTINIYINGVNLILLAERVLLNSMDSPSASPPRYFGLYPGWGPEILDEFRDGNESPFRVVLACHGFPFPYDALIANIQFDPTTVSWSNFRRRLQNEQGTHVSDYYNLGPFVFDREQYMEALNALGDLE